MMRVSEHKMEEATREEHGVWLEAATAVLGHHPECEEILAALWVQPLLHMSRAVCVYVVVLCPPSKKWDRYFARQVECSIFRFDEGATEERARYVMRRVAGDLLKAWDEGPEILAGNRPDPDNLFVGENDVIPEASPVSPEVIIRSATLPEACSRPVSERAAELQALAYLPPHLLALECARRGVELHGSGDACVVEATAYAAGPEWHRIVILRAILVAGRSGDQFVAMHPDRGEGYGETIEEALAALGRKPRFDNRCPDFVCLADGSIRAIPLGLVGD